MKSIRARVVSNDCSVCQSALLFDCQHFRLPPPAGEVIRVPASWASHKCEHGENGFVLEFLDAPQSADDASTESLRWKDEEEVESPPWWNNLDATKNTGYPAREAGRYGTYPSHDPFDDESEP